MILFCHLILDMIKRIIRGIDVNEVDKHAGNHIKIFVLISFDTDHV